VWFDQFRILSTGPLIVQETHYDPWGVELSGLGYQYGGIKVNPYLYNGKEANGHLGVNLYDYGARLYDPAIGRWFVSDPMAELAPDWTPYRYGFNNPLKYTDPTGMFEYSDGYSTQDSRNSTGSISFSGTYEYRTINTDLITIQHGENAPVSGGYIESYVKETGSVTGRSYFGSSPNLFGAGGFGDMGGYFQGSGGTDWSAFGNALTGGGIAYYSLEKSVNNSKYWVDAEGSIKSKELLKQGANGKYVRGVQGLRNGQKAAANVASKYAFAGKIVGGLGMGVTIIQYGTGQISGTEASIDLIMGGIGFTGWGAPISLTYFGGKLLYEYSTGNTLFDKPIGR